MSCGTANLKSVAGDILELTMKLYNGNAEITPIEELIPIDLTAYTNIVMQVRKKPNDPIVAEAELGDGLTVGGVDNNELYLNIQMPTTSGNYMYDIEFSATNVRETLIRGILVILPQITIIE